jgi:hypothetical protein
MQSFEVLTPAQVLNRIRPADPDTLLYVCDGIYRAEWMPGNPPVKDEIYLRGKQNIEIVIPLQASEKLDGTMFLCFRIIEV